MQSVGDTGRKIYVIIVAQVHQNMGFVAECNYMGARGHKPEGTHIVNTRRQIPCSDVPVLQLTCIIELSSFQTHAFMMDEFLSDDDFQPPKKRTRFALPSTSKELLEAPKGVLPKNTEKMISGLSVPLTSGLARETLSARKIAVQQMF